MVCRRRGGDLCTAVLRNKAYRSPKQTSGRCTVGESQSFRWHDCSLRYSTLVVEVSEDEDDDFEPADSIRPLVSHSLERRSTGTFRGIWREGGLGNFFFGTWTGWQIWVALLVFWVGGTKNQKRIQHGYDLGEMSS